MDLDNLTGNERIVGELILERPAPGKHAARHAIAHIQKAERLRDIDPEMALFRAFTGEEEAARAIFHSLQRLGYANARRLNWRSHKLKAAVVPFMAAMGKLAEQVGWGRAEIILGEVEGKRGLRVRYTVSLPNGKPVAFTCHPPFNVQMTIEGRTGLLDEEIAAVASDANFANMEKFVTSIANERNAFLYATEQGIPTVAQSIDNVLANRRSNIFSMLTLYLLVDPYRQQQRFVTQALQSFLAMTDRLPDPPTS